MSNSVTLKDVYEITQRLEEKFDEVLKDHEKRIRAQENFQTKLMAIGGMFSAFISLAATYIWNKVIPK